ncbi:MAG: MBL fold metallo-hydrolase [Jatrophihabitantaceae bacterium]
MLLTKYGHACVRITDGDRRLAIDPGSFSEVAIALEDLDAVLITHEHGDHVDHDALAAAATANQNLHIWAPTAVTTQFASSAALEGRYTPVGPGETFDAGGLQVRTFGGQHALIHSSVPVVANVAYLIADVIYHPGDSYVVPTARPELALVPINAPWAKLAETVDFAVSVRAPHAVGIHDALLSEIGRGGYGGHVARVGAEYGCQYHPLTPGESFEL